MKFSHKNVKLFNANVLDINCFDKPFIDLIVTSPPYNVGIEYNSNDDELNYEQYLAFSECNGCKIVMFGVIAKQDFV